uniref:Bm8971 n=1 Tax=Brugia malayi TaxID=6279 RepID=A0A0H5S311_BRUMA|nr:Bm8971 [Brugia malayi]
MGYDGGGLDKSSQELTELIPFSAQRGREGFGQPANQVIENCSRLECSWDFEEEEKPVEENVLWLSVPDDIREKFTRKHEKAAMKMANLNRIYDWLLMGEKPDNVEIRNPMNVEIKRGKNAGRLSSLFYFADICASPGVANYNFAKTSN